MLEIISRSRLSLVSGHVALTTEGCFEPRFCTNSIKTNVHIPCLKLHFYFVYTFFFELIMMQESSEADRLIPLVVRHNTNPMGTQSKSED